MTCGSRARPASGQYTIVTDYVADPDTNALLMKVAFTVNNARCNKPGADLRLYLRFDPTVNGNGGGGSGNGGADSATTDTSTGHAILVASDPNTTTNAVNRDYAQPVYAALDAPFAETTNGFAGTASDGLTQLDTSHALTTSYTTASNGNVVQTARVAGGKKDSGGSLDFTVALGFGASQAGAVQTAESAAAGHVRSGARGARSRAGTHTTRRLNDPPPTKLPGSSGSGSTSCARRTT